MVEAAVRMILGGAKLIATNLDPNCPTQHGLRPGCGAIVAMLEAATGVKAFSVGKPSPVMMRAARKELGLATDETIMIGDTMETDILGGVQLGYHTVLVLSGGTQARGPAAIRLPAGDRGRVARRVRRADGPQRLAAAVDGTSTHRAPHGESMRLGVANRRLTVRNGSPWPCIVGSTRIDQTTVRFAHFSASDPWELDRQFYFFGFETSPGLLYT